MTAPIEVLKLNNRQFDALVAEKIFGATWKGDHLWPAGWNLPVARRSKDGEVSAAEHLPFYSTAIAHAMKIVPRMKELRPDLGFKLLQSAGQHGWWAWFEEGEARDHPTPSMAICFAALRAVGV